MFHKKIVFKCASTNWLSDKSKTLIKWIARHRKRCWKHFFSIDSLLTPFFWEGSELEWGKRGKKRTSDTLLLWVACPPLGCLPVTSDVVLSCALNVSQSKITGISCGLLERLRGVKSKDKVTGREFSVSWQFLRLIVQETNNLLIKFGEKS